jgi:hypothetical protein
MRNSEGKLKRFPQGSLAHGQSLGSEGDNSKFLTREKSICNMKLSSMLT